MDPISITLLVIFGLIALLLIGIVLVQNEQSDGLGGIFGGSSSNQIGNRKGNIITRTTAILGTLFLLVCFVLALVNHRGSADREAVINAAKDKRQSKAVEWWNQAPPAAPTVTPGASPLPDAAVPAVPVEPSGAGPTTDNPAAAPVASPN